MVEQIKILYLDDEIHSLHGFKAALRNDFVVFTATNAKEAFEYLEQHHDIRIVLSDQFMPDQSGIDFFEQLGLLYPLPIRVLVTGRMEIEANIIEAINRGNIYRYLKKPWKIDTLQRVIAEANKYYIATSLLAQKNIELEQAYAELDKFAHSVSHDIRGPLAGIMSAVQLIKDIDDPKEKEEIIDIIGHSAQRLDRYIINVHDYYSVRRGQFSIMEINFKALKSELEGLYEASASSKGVDFSVLIDVSEPFRSDEMAIRLILTNLISNAFKYQKKGNSDKKVEVLLSVGKGIAVFVVKDNGIGIKEYYFEEIFNLFFRASLDEAGSGLGLYNVRGIVQKLGGEISVQSEYGRGSVFTVTLPDKG